MRDILSAGIRNENVTLFEFRLVTLAVSRGGEVALSCAHNVKARGHRRGGKAVCWWGMWAYEVGEYLESDESRVEICLVAEAS